MSKLNVFVGGPGGSHGGDVIGQLLARRPSYDVAIGCSTTAAMVPHILLGKYDKLSMIYQSLTNNKVWSEYPFTPEMKLDWPNAISQMLRKRMSLGEMDALGETIAAHFTEDEYQQLKKSGKEAVFVYTDMQDSEHVKFKKLSDTKTREECVTYMHSSMNIPIVSRPIIDPESRHQLTDGGTVEPFALAYALENFDCGNVDGYPVSHAEPPVLPPVKNIGEYLMRILVEIPSRNRRAQLRQSPRPAR